MSIIGEIYLRASIIVFLLGCLLKGVALLALCIIRGFYIKAAPMAPKVPDADELFTKKFHSCASVIQFKGLF